MPIKEDLHQWWIFLRMTIGISGSIYVEKNKAVLDISLSNALALPEDLAGEIAGILKVLELEPL